jgi:two-component system, sensor histidine kinase RpfC
LIPDPGNVLKIFDTIRRKLSGAQAIRALIEAAPLLEFRQAKLRVIVSTGICIWVLGYLSSSGAKSGVVGQAAIFAALYMLLALSLVAHILLSSKESNARRILGIVADNAILTYILLTTDEGGGVIFGFYLFVTLGNGFRYGRRFQDISHVLAICGFCLAMLVSNYWSEHRLIGFGFLLALGWIPLYTGRLAERIKEERKRADEANQAKGRFLAVVSHEMRTPLNGVVAMADVLRETKLSESQREIVDTLSTSANLLLAQIEDVLDMAKIEAGRVQIEQKPFDLGVLVTNTVKVVLPQARYKQLAVNTEISPEATGWFSGDSHHLRQVLLNLLSNAVKFTERGEIVLCVSPATTSTSGANVIRFEVRDTGIGIPPEKQSAIFEPFTQADDSITRVYGGTGLGTTIARQLVLAMGGQIGLSSTVGVGTAFWFELPMARSKPAGIDVTSDVVPSQRTVSSVALLAAQQAANITRIRGARILVAEDNPTNQRVTQMILQSGGHYGTFVDNGEAALDALERGSFDLALFDLSMPILSGLEALKLYQYTTQRPIPIVILSANVTTEIIADCQKAGCAEFLPKPIRPSILLDTIERHLAVLATELQPGSPPRRSDEGPTLTVVETPAVDMQVLSDLTRLSSDPTFIERLLRGFSSDTERLVKQIGAGLAERRYEEVKDLAHALKGGAGGVGASQLVQLAVRFEKANQEQMRLKAAAWMEELTNAADVALAAFDKYLEERRSQSQS